jgi:hypothetical protein
MAYKNGTPVILPVPLALDSELTTKDDGYYIWNGVGSLDDVSWTYCHQLLILIGFLKFVVLPSFCSLHLTFKIIAQYCHRLLDLPKHCFLSTA